MPEIPYSRFGAYLEETPPASLPPVILIHGEEAFCAAAAAALVERLLPGPEKAVGYEPVESDDVFAAIERVNTFSLFSGTRVIALPDSRIFHTREDHQALLRKAREAFEEDRLPKAARHFTAALGLLELSLGDAAHLSPGQQGVRIDPELWGDGAWFTALLAWCRDQGLSPAAGADRCAELQQAVARGFPDGNRLVITTEVVDKRRGLYKAILEKGLVVNCAVPMGGGRQEVQARKALLADHARAILGRSGKEMAPDAFRMMTEMTGFDIRTLTANLEKLIQFAGDRPVITAADVREVLTRTRQDPVYELTGALADRNAEAALLHLDALLAEGLAPLQILAAVINAVRRLLLARGFVVSPEGGAWRKGMGYTQFQSTVLPAVQAWDQALLSSLAEWEEADPDAGAESGGKGRRRSSGPATDLLLAPRGKSAYPVYLLLRNCERFKLTELIGILADLQQTDVRLKTSGGPPRLLLESVILRICQGR